MNKKTKNKIKYKGVSSYLEVLGLEEAAHNALDASIYRFSSDGTHFEVEIVDLQKF